MQRQQTGSAVREECVVLALAGDGAASVWAAWTPRGTAAGAVQAGAQRVVHPLTATGAALDDLAALAALVASPGSSCALAAHRTLLTRLDSAEHVQYMGAGLLQATALAAAAVPGQVLLTPDGASSLGLDAFLGDGPAELPAGTAGARALLWAEFEAHLAAASGRGTRGERGSGRAGRNRPRARQARPATDAVAGTAVPVHERLSAWRRGMVMRTGERFGFIEDELGHLYYFQARNLAWQVPLRRGAQVTFRAFPPARPGQEPRAEDVMVLGTAVRAVVTRTSVKGWAFAHVDCDNGLEHQLFVLGTAPQGLQPGQRITCTLGINREGPVGLRPQVVEEHAAVVHTVGDHAAQVPAAQGGSAQTGAAQGYPGADQPAPDGAVPDRPVDQSVPTGLRATVSATD